MSRKPPSASEIEWRVLSELQSLEGIYWKEVQGEYHEAYEGMAVWILLMDAREIGAAHKKFRAVVSSYSHLVRFTVSYSVRVPEGEMLLECLNSNEAIDNGGSICALGANPQNKRRPSVFRT